jgi:hypothetical protein
MPHTSKRRTVVACRHLDPLESRVLLSGKGDLTFHTGHSHTVLRDAALAVPSSNTPNSGNGPDYPGAIWDPAAPGNYSTDPSDPRWIAIHTTEENATAAITEFTTAGTDVSVNYLMTLTGVVYQFVPDADIAYDVGNYAYNTDSIGIEDERYGNIVPTEAEYVANAKLVDWIAKQYNIPLVHYAASGAAGTPASVAPADPTQGTGIIGHYQVPDPSNSSLGGGASHHTDPVDWNWLHYMSLVDGNYGPLTPTTVAPAKNTAAPSTTPKLTASAFVDNGYQTSQAAAQWQIYYGTALVYDSSTDTTDLSSITVPSGKLTTGKTYTWQVRYEDNYGVWSSYSTRSTYTVIPTVNSLTARALSDSSIALSWRTSPGSGSKLDIERSVAGGKFVQIALLSGTKTTFTDIGLLPNMRYTYRIRAVTNSGIAGSYVTAAPVKTPPSPKRRR